MIQPQINNSLIINRLTALWALNECGLGGFMHAFSSPFTGIIVGGVSILLITLIASNAQNIATTLTKALIIVLLVKLSVSPHSPLPAYFAVSFQGLLGIGIFKLLSVNAVSIVLVTILSFLESALQKLITLTIIYGQSLWEAIDNYIAWIGNKLHLADTIVSSKHLIFGFLGFYAFSGFLVGLLILRIHKLVNTVKIPDDFNLRISSSPIYTKKETPKRKRRHVLLWFLIIILIVTPLFFFKNSNNGWSTGLYLIARSLIIIGIWYVIIGPLLLRLLNKFLRQKQSRYQTDISQTLLLLPHLKSIVMYTWNESKHLKGFGRFQYFISRSIVYSFHINIED